MPSSGVAGSRRRELVIGAVVLLAVFVYVQIFRLHDEHRGPSGLVAHRQFDAGRVRPAPRPEVTDSAAGTPGPGTQLRPPTAPTGSTSAGTSASASSSSAASAPKPTPGPFQTGGGAPRGNDPSGRSAPTAVDADAHASLGEDSSDVTAVDSTAVEGEPDVQDEPRATEPVPDAEADPEGPSLTALESSTDVDPQKPVAASAPPPPPLPEPLPSFRGGYTPHSFPIAIVAYNRPDYLRRCLQSLLNDVRFVRPALITVYQDGHDAAMLALKSEFSNVRWVHHDRTPKWEGAAYIASHYKFLLGEAFSHWPDAQHLLILEEDMIFAPDLLLYFAQLAALLDVDPSLWCVSSWNDNGFEEHVRDPAALYRTDFFIGLGWLMPRRVWEEVSPVWPASHWDHWMRSPAQRKGRQCVFPEISRNYNIGVHGTHSDTRLYEQYFGSIALQREPSVDLGDVMRMTSDRYREAVEATIREAVPVRDLTELRQSPDGRVRAVYIRAGAELDEGSWSQVARYFHVWHSVPIRGAYSGTLSFWMHGHRVVLVLSASPFYALKPSGAREFRTHEFV